jgi:hypothetical protein
MLKDHEYSDIEMIKDFAGIKRIVSAQWIR